MKSGPPIFHYLTAEQLSPLTYTLRYVQRHLKRLSDWAFATPLIPDKQPRFGTAPYVYTLTGRIRAYVKKYARARIAMTLDRYWHWITHMGRNAADGIDDALSL